MDASGNSTNIHDNASLNATDPSSFYLEGKFNLFYLRSLFYLIGPNDKKFHCQTEISSVSDLKNVPDFFSDAIPMFMVLSLVEIAVGLWMSQNGSHGDHGFHVNDYLTSWSAGILSHMVKISIKSLEMAVYIWVFTNVRLATLTLNSWPHWVAALLATDLAYYWFHRASHEVNILWAAHQVHHSSEEFNLSVALRQSVLSHLGSWFFYLPMAVVGFSPVTFIIHYQFNLLYQFWIHTSVIKSLGFLELVLNTPSHHRAHHGRNPIYIDINYGGVLIIWDRLFGTFRAEDPKEPAFYGLVVRLESFNAIWVQIARLVEIRRRIKTFPAITEKIQACINGPRWRPGLPRMGILQLIPIFDKEKDPERKYNPQIPGWMTIYGVVHFTAVLPYFFALLRYFNVWSFWASLFTMSHVTLSLANIGSVFDNRSWIAHAEASRCIILAALCPFLPGFSSVFLVCLLCGTYALSSFLWAAQLAALRSSSRRAAKPTGSAKKMR